MGRTARLNIALCLVAVLMMLYYSNIMPKGYGEVVSVILAGILIAFLMEDKDGQ